MSLDSFFAAALVSELGPRLIGSRAQKISQLSDDDFLIHWRSPGRTDRLFLSVHPERSRFHLLEGAHAAAQVPSAFLMLARKHLGGCRLLDFQQHHLDRSVEWVFSSGYSWLLDWAGRPPCLLLLEPETRRVLGAYPPRGRFPLRQAYTPPPGLNPETLTLENAQNVWRALQAEPPESDRLATLRSLCPGWPPVWPLRLAEQSQSSASFLQRWEAITAPLRAAADSPGNPRRAWSARGELTYLPPPPGQISQSLSQACQSRWSEGTAAPGVPDTRSQLLRKLRQGRERAQRKRDKRRQDQIGAESASRDQLFGDLLLSYASQISGRSSRFTTQDWEGRACTIELDPWLTPTENAERYYRRAKKKKRALLILEEQIALAQQEVDFWDELLLAAERSENRADLEEVRRAIPSSPQRSAKRRPEAPSSGPRRFEHDGFPILVGRNPLQNERLSLREAARDDLWFHVRQGAGSHVLLRTQGRQPSPATHLAAAWLAAHYSHAQGDNRCLVISTPARWLKKPKGGTPGKVLYRGEQEIVVDATAPQPEGLRRLDKKDPSL